jgi:hypothetical protein
MAGSVSKSVFDALSEEVWQHAGSDGIWKSHKLGKGLAACVLKQKIMEADLGDHETLKERLWALRVRQPIRPVCAVCGGKVPFHKPATGYHRCCSVKCAANEPARNAKIQSTIKERYGSQIGCNSPKGRQTNLEKYGYENVMHNPEIAKKVGTTAKERYGSENGFNSPKARQSNLERYGHEYAMQNSAIAAKVLATSTAKYGGNFHPAKRLATMLERYGVKCPLQDPDIHQRACATNILRYGFPYPLQNPDIHRKAIHNSYRTKQFTLPSGAVVDLQGYEPQVLAYILGAGIYAEGELSFDVPSVPTPWGGRYTADFLVPGEHLLIEVKSTYTWFHERNAGLARRKATAARDAGYSVEVWVWREEQRRPEVIPWCWPDAV